MKAKEFIPASKPRNFVAKNAPKSGAGRHKDSNEKKAQKQGYEKHKGKGVSEGIRVVDQDYDLDQIILTLDIEGRRASFTYTDYDENFENAERKDVFDQLQEKSWYKDLDHPTKMEILDAAYKAIRGEEPSEYKPRVDDEPLDIDEGAEEDPPEEEMDRTVSDLHKDVFGIRPSPEWGREWMSMSEQEKRDLYYQMVDMLDQQQDMAEGNDDWGSMSHREFKRRELQHELGHEDDPDFERKMMQKQMDRDKGPWYIRIDGKIYKQKGEPKVFDWRKGANNYALAMVKNRPELKDKIMLTRKPVDESSEIPFTECPECRGPIFHESLVNEKQDACYHKVRSRYKVWPSAYASGALVQCRKKGAKNWGNKSKK
jgi:hypothetical protein